MQALMQRDSGRTRVWFPLFSFFESSVGGIVPNEFAWPVTMEQVRIWIQPLIVTLVAAILAARQKGVQVSTKQS
jgi:hypothetical protein